MMRFSLGLLTRALFFAFCASAPAADSKPEALSAQEVADGWLLLFDEESSFGWQSRGSGKWSVQDGVISYEFGIRPEKFGGWLADFLKRYYRKGFGRTWESKAGGFSEAVARQHGYDPDEGPRTTRC